MLEELGVHGRPTLEKCEAVKKERELKAELDSLDTSLIINETSRRTRTRNTSQNRPSYAVDDSTSDEEEEDEEAEESSKSKASADKANESGNESDTKADDTKEESEEEDEEEEESDVSWLQENIWTWIIYTLQLLGWVPRRRFGWGCLVTLAWFDLHLHASTILLTLNIHWNLHFIYNLHLLKDIWWIKSNKFQHYTQLILCTSLSCMLNFGRWYVFFDGYHCRNYAIEMQKETISPVCIASTKNHVYRRLAFVWIKWQ